MAFQFGSLVKLWRKSQSSFPLEVLSALSLAYILLSQSRTSSLGVLLMLFVLPLLTPNWHWKSLKILALAASIVIIIKFCIIPLLHPDTGNFFVPKSYSIRWLLYWNTLRMIFENPFGVGVGQFQFASIPYLRSSPEFDEMTLYRNPHNEFLRFLAEDGVITSFLYLLLASSLIYYLWKDIQKIFYSYPEFIFFSLILLVQAVFQFPLMNPVPYFLTALMVGYFFSLRKDEFFICKFAKTSKTFLIGSTLMGSVVFTAAFSSRYIYFNYPRDLSLNRLACHMGDPIVNSVGSHNWLACLNVASTYFKEKEYAKAESYALRTLYWQPLNYQGIKLLGFSLLYQGHKEKACDLFKKYDSFFRSPTSVDGIIKRECS